MRRALASSLLVLLTACGPHWTRTVPAKDPNGKTMFCKITADGGSAEPGIDVKGCVYVDGTLP